MKIWWNWRIVDSSRSLIAADDPAFTHGVGLFETMRLERGQALFVARHLHRLRASARALALNLRIPEDCRTIAARLARSARLERGLVRLVATERDTMIAVGAAPAIPQRWYRSGGFAQIARWRRDPQAPLARHKSLAYWEAARGRDAARARGAVDMLVRGIDGRWLEGTVTNLFLVHGRRLITAPRRDVLPGITRQLVLELARSGRTDQRLSIDERAVLDCDLRIADEAFLTNALIGLVPLRQLGQYRFPAPGPATSNLTELYQNRVERDLRLSAARS